MARARRSLPDVDLDLGRTNVTDNLATLEVADLSPLASCPKLEHRRPRGLRGLPLVAIDLWMVDDVRDIDALATCRS